MADAQSAQTRNVPPGALRHGQANGGFFARAHRILHSLFVHGLIRGFGGADYADWSLHAGASGRRLIGGQRGIVRFLLLLTTVGDSQPQRRSGSLTLVLLVAIVR
jgi:hypothetical protein